MNQQEIISRIQSLQKGQRFWYWDTREHNGEQWGTHIEFDLNHPDPEKHPVQAEIIKRRDAGEIVTMQEKVGEYGNGNHFLYWIVGAK